MSKANEIWMGYEKKKNKTKTTTVCPNFWFNTLIMSIYACNTKWVGGGGG